MRIIIFTVCLIMLLTTLGISKDTQGDGLTLLQIEQGAKAVGMGGAFASVAGDLNSVVYNPAGVVGVDIFTASFGHSSYWENIQIESGFFAKNLKDKLYWHGSIIFASVDNLELRNSPTQLPDGIFEVYDISFKSGLAYKLNDQLSIGFGMGWIIEKIESWRGSAFNIDGGITYKVNDYLNLGASVTNVGKHFYLEKPGMQKSRYITLPITYRAGGSYKFNKFIGAIDIVNINDESHLHLGSEYLVHEYLSVRAGYMTNYDTKNITAGASFYYKNIIVDYGFVPYTDNLGTSHLFNLTFSL